MPERSEPSTPLTGRERHDDACVGEAAFEAHVIDLDAADQRAMFLFAGHPVAGDPAAEETLPKLLE
jgi:hypothetical protein